MSAEIGPGSAIEFVGPTCDDTDAPPIGTIWRCASVIPVPIGFRGCGVCTPAPDIGLIIVGLNAHYVWCPNHWRPIGGDMTAEQFRASITSRVKEPA